MKRSLKQLFLSVICIVLIAAMALFFAGCRDASAGETPSSGVSEKVFSSGQTLGTGETKFTFTVMGTDGVEKNFTIQTDKKTVGEALLEVGIIAEDTGDYGLFVKSVNGENHDYSIDGKYWAFYVDGQYASSGVSSTNVEEGKTYTFKAE